MHLTLRQDAASPPAATLRAQQKRFATFRANYNDERPHAALGNATPSERYAPSPRRWDGILRDPEPPASATMRRVRRNGVIKWQGAEVFIGEALIGEPVALVETEDGRWTVAFGPVGLGVLDKHGRRLQRPRKPDQNSPPEHR